MCIAPGKLANGQKVQCRKCWLCRLNKIDDWVGRCIAESETARATSSITLTYGRDLRTGGVDHERSAVLTYSDVQKYIKLLRRHGYPCRYFAVGEFGSKKGRAHWHVLVFWHGDVPEHQLDKNFDERHWPHGYSFWQEPSPAAIRYVCKYIQKDMGEDGRQGHLAMSKKPPLGDQYFYELAGRYVAQQVSPIEPYYWFPHVRDEEGKPLKFYMSGVTLDNFCQSFLDQWQVTHGGHPPPSRMIEDYCDRVARVEADPIPQRYRPGGSRPWVQPPGGAPIQFSEAHNTYFYVLNGERKWWSYDQKGELSWQKDIRVDPNRIPRSRIPTDLMRYPA